MRTSGLIAYLTILITLYRGTMLWLGEETVNNISEFMFGPYVDLYNLHFRQMMPGWDSPFVIIILLAFCGDVFLELVFRVSNHRLLCDSALRLRHRLLVSRSHTRATT